MKKLFLIFILIVGIYGCEADDIEIIEETPLVTQPSIVQEVEEPKIPVEILGTRPPIYQGMSLEAPTINTSWSRLDYRVSLSMMGRFSLDAIFSTQDIAFYSEINEDILIHVKTFNPDGQSILRLTINDVIYQSFQFQPGSDSETIIIKLNSGEEPGIQELTIKEIKYVENNTNLIKDAVFDGDQTIRFGVSFNVLPEVDIKNLQVESNQLRINLLLQDQAQLINIEEYPILFRLFKEDLEIKTIELILEDEEIQLENLIYNSEYTYTITATYDRVDGLGQRDVSLTQGSFETAKILTINTVVASENSATIAYDLMETELNLSFSAINIYLNDELVKTSTDANQLTMTNLLSNTTYKIEVVYEYLVSEEIVQIKVHQSFNTVAKNIPSLSNVQITPTQTEIIFDFELEDVSEVASIASIRILSGQEVIQSLDNLDRRSIENLLANQDYTLEIIVTYDLNDGNGIQQQAVRENFKTGVYQVPKIESSILDILRNSVELVLNVNDPDGSGKVSKIEIFLGENLVRTITGTSQSSDVIHFTLEELSQFDGQDGRDAYIAVDGIVYDVTNSPHWRDGIQNGDSSTDEENNLTSQIQTMSPHGIRVLDNVPRIGVMNNGLIQVISELSPEQEYKVKITFEYNLQDGTGLKTITEEKTFTTLSSSDPIINISASGIGHDFIEFNVSIIDEDHLGSIEKIEIFLGDDVVLTITQGTIRRIENLQSNTNYVLKVTYQYDLEDHEEDTGREDLVFLQSISKSYAFKTLSYNAPLVSFSAINVSQSTISWTLSLIDPNQLIESYQVELWRQNELIQTISNQITGSFYELLSGTEYQIKVIYIYNLQDGKESITQSMNQNLNTLQRSVPTANLVNSTLTTEAVSFGVQLNDPDSIGTVSAIRLKLSSELIEEVENENHFNVENLRSNTTYVVEVVIHYQLNINEPILSKTQTFNLRTLTKATPTVNTANIVPEKNAINFELNIQDNDNTGSIDEIQLFVGLSLVAVFGDLETFNEYSLDPNTSYRIRFVYLYDLNDGTEEKTVVHQIISQTLLMNGSGIEEDPYQIENEEDLSNIRESLSSYYILINDIYITQENWNPIGSHPRNHFSGHFDGQGYSIYGLNIHQSYEEEHITFGLFRTILEGTVKNLVISNASINISLTTTDHTNPNIAILAGQIFSSSIQNIHVSGEVIFNATGGLIQHVAPNIGGVIATTSRSNLNKISSDVIINAYVKGTAYSHLNVGGIIGNHFSSTLENTLAFGTLYCHSAGATARVGGIVGHNYSVIKNAYADVSITAEVSISHSNSVARGGLIIGSGDYNGYIFDSVGLGHVSIKTAPTSSSGFSQGLFGTNWGSINNSFFESDSTYTLNSVDRSFNATWMIDSNLVNKEWLINELNFNPEIWNLENFDSLQKIEINLKRH